MLKILVFLTMIIWAREGSAAADTNPYCPTQGFCDFTAMEWTAKPVIAIDATWDFYEQKLLRPLDIPEGSTGSAQPMQLHQRWRDVKEFAGDEIHSFGTYQLRLKLSPQQIYSLKFPDFASASQIWLNGVLIRENGRVGISPSEEAPRLQPFIHTFVAEDVNTITLQVSNFSSYFNGARGSLYLGHPEEIAQASAHDVMLDAIIIGCIVIMAFYHVYLWYLRPHRFTPLYYAMFCLSIGLRSLIVGQGRLITLIASGIPFEVHYKIEYMTMGFAGTSLLLVIHTLYRKEFSKKMCSVLVGFTALLTLLVCLTSARTYPGFLPIFQLHILVSCSLAIYAVGLAFLRKREGAGLFLAGFGLFFLTVVNDILLANRVIPTFVMAHMGMFGFILFQAMILSFRFDMAFDRAEAAERESRRLNESLEIKVADRTREIQTILLHVKSGFLAVDERCTILPGFTRSCLDLFGEKLAPGDSLVEVISKDHAAQAHFRLALSQVFEDSLPIDVSLEQLQRRVSIQGRVLSLSGSEIRDEGSGRITAILLTIHDVTSLQRAEQKAAHNEMLIKILQNWDSFQMFLKDFWIEMEYAREACQDKQDNRLRTLLHTMKGNLATFGIQDSVQLIHTLENKEFIQLADLQDIDDCMQKIQSACADLVALEGTDAKRYTYNESEYAALKRLVEKLRQEPERAEIQNLLDQAHRPTLRSYLGPIHQNLTQVASFLGKDIVLDVTGADLKVDSHFSPLLRSLIHLVRNAADHGIELPHERGRKDPLGHIRLSFETSDQHLVIKVEDDGRGLDFERIKAKAIELGLAVAEQELSELIFHPSFSTADELTEISGRGVGLSAVKEAVEKLGGTIGVTSRAFEGCSFVITVPLLTSRLIAA